jgi:hypothetical protein
MKMSAWKLRTRRENRLWGLGIALFGSVAIPTTILASPYEVLPEQNVPLLIASGAIGFLTTFLVALPLMPKRRSPDAFVRRLKEASLVSLFLSVFVSLFLVLPTALAINGLCGNQVVVRFNGPAVAWNRGGKGQPTITVHDIQEDRPVRLWVSRQEFLTVTAGKMVSQEFNRGCLGILYQQP